ncbi:MAG: maltose phosphorylase [Bacteroidetes bacterium GWE2_41_25]|nr:MAG: maltose phosphorylase [Bacteroidetes bacterium GWE2_41_25]OFY57258.1 MAG: maltose phosphorylase [Bacteroidetes bacterium GWF2_41_9]HBH84435.1 family 65 glycosyl hydrolase [Bacteroidales bacterium]HCU17924.1 family 65 glycosyl hydrolase [Bacteroidales bacterium]
MNNLFKYDEWLIIEEGFHPELNREAESIFSIGNGHMGQRANFEENYSGDSLQGSYVAGVYYPDKTRVGWWKNGYPEYFAKVLNAPKWTGIDLSIDGKTLDLAKSKIGSFTRVLNMKEGYLERSFIYYPSKGKSVEINTRRFLSMADNDLGIIRYSVKSLDFDGSAEFNIYLDGDVRNEDTNYREKFWKDVFNIAESGAGIITSATLKTDFHVTTGMRYVIHKNGKIIKISPEVISRDGYTANRIKINFKAGDELAIYKYVSVQSSLNHDKNKLVSVVGDRTAFALRTGYTRLFESHRKEWEKIWSASDVVIEGDIAAQQAIRFNIFHLNQTYTGKDERLNIGPKGFTGEKYGGSTYWDTEAFALPFFLKTAPMKVAKNLLIYRYKHLQKSIENGAKLGFRDGAALYPMVTMNGEECHNEWEITFEEIHRNGAIAFAIYNYIRHTGDTGYIAEYGLEVLIGISRFWSQRTTYSENLGKYVILGVTGPNEYENNVNNNWYTNTIAVWTLIYTLRNIADLKKNNPAALKKIISGTSLKVKEETMRWEEITKTMHFPFDEKRKVFLQQDCFLDKELKPAESIPKKERPINQHWSWDRILRSCFIKQADVLQGLYFLEENYDTETIKRNFDFYEPMTVHESSLSACVHSILASRIGNIRKAYELYLRTARLDLDDYNREVSDGLHITSMAGAWLAIVEGFGGMRIISDRVSLNPLIPEQWKSYSFHARFREILFEVKVTTSNIRISNLSDKTLSLRISEKNYEIKGHGDMSDCKENT